MLRLAELGALPAEDAAGVDEVLGVKGASAGVALVAAGPVVVAVGAAAFDVAVGKEPAAAGTVGQPTCCRGRCTPFPGGRGKAPGRPAV